jgi:segregation and condensation protein A
VSAKERGIVGELPFEGEQKAEPVRAELAPASEPAEKLKKKAPEHPFPFSVTVGKVYDGPLDLLLDLIRKQDIDIWDIPIARITAQFLSYVEQLKETDVDNAGEFIYTASLLIHIKSRMLLPREPREGLEDAVEDPRMELVERLLEHERFKNAAQMLLQKQQIEAATWTRPQLKRFLNEAGIEGDIEGEIAADVPDLVRVFRDILDRLRKRPVLDMEEDAVTVGQMIDYVRRRLLMEDRPVALSRMLANSRSERSLIAMFLALLEMVRLQAILLRQDANFAEVFVKKQDGFEALMEERMRSLKDDWQ